MEFCAKIPISSDANTTNEKYSVDHRGQCSGVEYILSLSS